MASKSKQPAPPGKSCKLCEYPTWQVSHHRSGHRDKVIEFGPERMEKVSSNLACIGCKIVGKAWRFESTSDKEVLPEYMFLYKGDRISFALHRGYYSIREIDVFTLPDRPRVRHVRQASLVPLDTRPDNSLPMIQQWLSECSRNHPVCSEVNRYVPPRLLDLSLADNAIRLVTAADILAHDGKDLEVEDFRYACLSHCWGSAGPQHTTPKHMLVEDSMQQNLRCVPLEDLSATFRQAVEVCRQLDIRYLWIDSLCIVQDSPSDWGRHVSEMREIYQHGYVTLAAAASGNGEGGLYRENSTQTEPRHRLSFTENDGDYEVLFREWQNSGYDRSSTSPLFHRGWVVQERLLSRRFVSFGPLEVVWECQESVSCPCTIEPYRLSPNIPVGVGVRYSFHDDLKVQLARLDTLPPAKKHLAWREIVTLYTSCSLTKASDRLPAIAGLARLFQQSLRDEYISGLWRSELRTDIAWIAGANRPRDPRNGRTHKGPSWLWSSAEEGKVTYAGLTDNKTFSIQDVSLSRQFRDDEFGYLDSASLTIHGLIFPITLSSDADSDHFQRFPSLLIGTFTVDDGLADGERAQGELYADYQFWGESDEAFLSEPTSFMFFFLGMKARWGRRQSTTVGHHFAQGLLLRETRDCDSVPSPESEAKDTIGSGADTPKRYERVAALRYHIGHQFDRWAGSSVPKSTFMIV